jgi:hypothetical protein
VIRSDSEAIKSIDSPASTYSKSGKTLIKRP